MTNTKFSSIKNNPYYNSWFELWKADKRSTLVTMLRNLESDIIIGGYSIDSELIFKQIKEIESYRQCATDKINNLSGMRETDREQKCFDDLIKRGVI